MDNLPFEIFTLSNGMRLVAAQSDGLACYSGVYIKAGSRDEAPGQEGLAHFLEHSIFKGTSKRKGWQISSRMEEIGGDLNAYTTKDHTMVYTKAPAGYDERGIELMADIIGNSIFPEKELDKEKDVVIEEINSYLDSPTDCLFDEFDEKIFSGSTLAHPILGYPESVRNIKPEDCHSFINNLYTPARMTAYSLSPLEPKKCARLFEKHFGKISRPDTYSRVPVTPAPQKFNETCNKENHQTSCVLGVRLFGREDPRRVPLYLTCHYLGGAFNSRLNRELREKRGLVYSVYSSIDMYDDVSLFGITFGCSPESVDKCMKLIERELDKLTANRISDKTLETIKRQYCGHLVTSADKRPGRIVGVARTLATTGIAADTTDLVRKINAVTADEMADTAALISYDNLSTLIYK